MAYLIGSIDIKKVLHTNTNGKIKLANTDLKIPTINNFYVINRQPFTFKYRNHYLSGFVHKHSLQVCYFLHSKVKY